MSSEHVKRVRAFLAAYPHDEPNNLHPDRIFAFGNLSGEFTLFWDDLKALCDDADENGSRPI